MPFVSDAQRKHFFANNGGSDSAGAPSFPKIDADEAYRLNAQRNDDRIYERDYEAIRNGEGASKEAMAAYFRSAEVEEMNRKESEYSAMWSEKKS